MAISLLLPCHTIPHDCHTIVVAKAKQGVYYNRHTHPLTKLKFGDGVHISLSGGPLGYVMDCWDM